MTHMLSYSILADAVMSLHFAVVVFVLGGLVFIIVGGLTGRRLARSLRFRVAHLATVAVVAVQAWLGAICPLTTLEMWLRAKAGQATYSGGFIEHWLERLLYYDAPLWIFAIVYSAFGLVVLATWWYFPPKAETRLHISRDPQAKAPGRS